MKTYKTLNKGEDQYFVCGEKELLNIGSRLTEGTEVREEELEIKEQYRSLSGEWIDIPDGMIYDSITPTLITYRNNAWDKRQVATLKAKAEQDIKAIEYLSADNLPNFAEEYAKAELTSDKYYTENTSEVRSFLEQYGFSPLSFYMGKSFVYPIFTTRANSRRSWVEKHYATSDTPEGQLLNTSDFEAKITQSAKAELTESPEEQYSYVECKCTDNTCTYCKFKNLIIESPEEQVSEEMIAHCLCGVPNQLHGTACGWINAKFIIHPQNEFEKQWNAKWIEAHPNLYPSVTINTQSFSVHHLNNQLIPVSPLKDREQNLDQKNDKSTLESKTGLKDREQNYHHLSKPFGSDHSIPTISANADGKVKDREQEEESLKDRVRFLERKLYSWIHRKVDKKFGNFKLTEERKEEKKQYLRRLLDENGLK